MTDKDTFQTWITQTPWGAWSRSPLPSDASARSYCRLIAPDGGTVMAVNDPEGPLALAHFKRVADTLRAGGLRTPEILHQDPRSGHAILTDMGRKSVADTLRHDPKSEPHLYAAITDVLCTMHKMPLPEWLAPLTPERASAAIAPLGQHYAPGIDLAQIQTVLADALARQPDPLAFAHRDFHAENLIWRAEESGTDRIGLIDFQDAVSAPPAYDLASLTRDARRDVPPKTSDLVLTRYAEKTGADLGQLRGSVALWAVQRNLRILGRFAQLNSMGKPHYLALMPRLWNYLQADLSHPHLRALAQALRDLPPPESSTP